ILFIAFMLYALNGYHRSLDKEERLGSVRRITEWLTPLLAGVLPLVLFLVVDPLNRTGTTAQYSGREGVLEIDPQGNLFWDGMWHSKLAENGTTWQPTTGWSQLRPSWRTNWGKLPMPVSSVCLRASAPRHSPGSKAWCRLMPMK